MCGRFAQIEPVEIIAQRLALNDVTVKNSAPRYNICPGEDVVALVYNEHSMLRELTWGLVPHWVKKTDGFKPFINARVETVAQKQSFKKAFFTTRCVVCASGFYEWKKEGNRKIPYYITGDGFFGLAGIADTALIDGKQVDTCALLTTGADEQMSAVHDRMPVIIRHEEFDKWINNASPEEFLHELIQPSRMQLVMHAVSPRVNNPHYKSADCIAPV